MKNFILCLMAVGMLSVATPISVKANTVAVENTSTVAKPEASAEAKLLIARIDEIKAMDKSNMTRAEKKALRKEVRTLHTQLAAISGGIYLSAGAVIVILLLLLILF